MTDHVPPPLPTSELLPQPPARPPGARRPRVLPAMLVGLLTMPFASLVSGAVMIAMLLLSGMDMAALAGDSPMEALAAQPQVLFAVLVAQFAALGLVPLAAVYRSHEGPRAALGLVAPGLRWWLYPFVVIGSFGFMGLSGLVTQLLVDAGVLPMMEDSPGEALLNLPMGWKIACLVVMGVGPGVCEELVFRGYVQRRLALRWRPWTAIAVSSVLFGIAHVHPMHMVLAAIMGLWLGWLAHRTGSIIPSIVGHFFVDFLVFGAVAFGLIDGDPSAEAGPADYAWTLVIIAVGLAGAGVVVAFSRPQGYRIIDYRRPNREN